MLSTVIGRFAYDFTYDIQTDNIMYFSSTVGVILH